MHEKETNYEGVCTCKLKVQPEMIGSINEKAGYIKGTAQGGSNCKWRQYLKSAQLGTVYLLELHLTAFVTNDGKTAYKIHCMHHNAYQ